MQFAFQSMSISAAEPFAKNAAEMESISPSLQMFLDLMVLN